MRLISRAIKKASIKKRGDIYLSLFFVVLKFIFGDVRRLDKSSFSFLYYHLPARDTSTYKYSGLSSSSFFFPCPVVRHQKLIIPISKTNYKFVPLTMPFAEDNDGEQNTTDPDFVHQISSNSALRPSSSSSSSHFPSCRFSLLSSLNVSPSTVAPALAISSQYPPILCIAEETKIAFYDLPDLRQITAYAAAGPNSGSVKSVVFSPDASRIFTAHQDCTIRVWSASLSSNSDKKRRLVATLPTFSDCLRHFALPSNYVVIRRHKRALWMKHVDAVSSLAIADNLLYSASWDKTIKIWNVTSNFRCVHTLKAHHDAVNTVIAAPDDTIYTGSSDKRIKVWTKLPSESSSSADTSNPNSTKKKTKHELMATLEKHRSSSAVNAVALSPDGTVLYSGTSDPSIVVWEKVYGREEHMVITKTWRGHEKAVMCLATVDDLVFSGSTDRTVRIWRRAYEEPCIGVLVGHQKGVRSLVACRVITGESDDRVVGYVVCSGSVDGEVKLWKVLVSI